MPFIALSCCSFLTRPITLSYSCQFCEISRMLADESYSQSTEMAKLNLLRIPFTRMMLIFTLSGSLVVLTNNDLLQEF